MWWRVLGGAVVLALAGGAAGYGVAAGDEDQPDEVTPALAELVPVPADPSIPVPSISANPDDPTLETDIAVDAETLTVPDDKGKPKYELRLPVPVGWNRTEVAAGWWNYTKIGNSKNTYGLRVQILADEGLSLPGALQARTAALHSAETQGNLSDLEIDESGFGFTASYLDSGGFQRVNVERFYPGPDPNVAFATVAGTGREDDLDGLTDLVDRISIDLRTSTP